MYNYYIDTIQEQTKMLITYNVTIKYQTFSVCFWSHEAHLGILEMIEHTFFVVYDGEWAFGKKIFIAGKFAQTH